MSEAVTAVVAARLSDDRVLGQARPFEVQPAPFRKWIVRLFTRSRTQFVDVELDASELMLRTKSLKAKFAPSLKVIDRMEGVPER